MRSTVRSPRSVTPWPLALRLSPQPTCVSLHGPLNLLSSQPSFLFLPGVTRNTALRQDTLVRRRGPPSTAEKGKRCLARQERRKVGTPSTLGRALPARVEWVHLRSSGGERKNATDVGDQHNVLRFPIRCRETRHQATTLQDRCRWCIPNCVGDKTGACPVVCPRANWVFWPTSHLAGWGKLGMDNGWFCRLMGVLVIDPSGSVLSLLRSLELGVPLWRVTNGQELDLTDIALAVVAVAGPTRWGGLAAL